MHRQRPRLPPPRAAEEELLPGSIHQNLRAVAALRAGKSKARETVRVKPVGGDPNDGVLPESLSADFLAKATAVRDDSADTVTAHAITFAAAFHQHKDGEAAQRLETCLAYASRATPTVREALMSDAAVFQARRRKRA